MGSANCIHKTNAGSDSLAGFGYFFVKRSHTFGKCLIFGSFIRLRWQAFLQQPLEFFQFIGHG